MADENKKQSFDDFAKEYLAGFEKWKEQHEQFAKEREKTIAKMASVICGYVCADAAARVIATALVDKGYGGNLEDFYTDCLNYKTELLGKAQTIEHLEWRVEQLSTELASETEEHRKFVCEVAEKIEAAKKLTAINILSDLYLWIGQDFDDIPDGGFIHILKEDFKRRMNEFYKRYGVEVE